MAKEKKYRILLSSQISICKFNKLPVYKEADNENDTIIGGT
jgi:hypothetical protein